MNRRAQEGTCIRLAARKMMPQATTSHLNRTHSVVLKLHPPKQCKVLSVKRQSRILSTATNCLSHL